MCNLYNLKVERWEVMEYYGAQDTWRDELEKDYVSPGRPGCVAVSNGAGLDVTNMRWGFPPPQGIRAPVVNVRNYSSPFWRSFTCSTAVSSGILPLSPAMPIMARMSLGKHDPP